MGPSKYFAERGREKSNCSIVLFRIHGKRVDVILLPTMLHCGVLRARATKVQQIPKYRNRPVASSFSHPKIKLTPVKS